MEGILVGELIYAEGQFLDTFSELFELVERYPPEKRTQSGACGNWSPKEVLAHLAGWLVIAQKRYDDFEAGDKSNIDYAPQQDRINAESVAVRAHLNWRQTIAELRLGVFALSSRASDIPKPVAQADQRYAEWLVGIGEDAKKHTQQLRDFLETQT